MISATSGEIVVKAKRRGWRWSRVATCVIAAATSVGLWAATTVASIAAVVVLAATGLWVVFVKSRVPHQRTYELLEAMGMAVVVADEHDTILRASLATARIFGFSVDEIVGKKLALLCEEPISEGRMRSRAKDGRRLELVLDVPKNAAAEHTVVFRDITAFVSATHELELEKDNRDSLIQSMGVPVIVADDTMTILEVNAAASLVFGHDKADLLGQPVTMLMPETMRANHATYVRTHLATGVNRIVGITNGRHVTGLRADGTALSLVLNIAKSRLAGGKILFTAVFQDITELAATSKELALQKKALRDYDSLIRGLGVCAFMLDDSAKIVVAANPAAAAMFGYVDGADLVGTRVAALIEMDTSAILEAHGSSRQDDVKGIGHRHGKPLQLVVHASRSRGDDGTVQYVIFCEDRTELALKADELEIQKKVLSQFTCDLLLSSSHFLSQARNVRLAVSSLRLL